MDIESVGEEMATVEIRGQSIVPDVTVRLAPASLVLTRRYAAMSTLRHVRYWLCVGDTRGRALAWSAVDSDTTRGTVLDLRMACAGLQALETGDW
eukprot:576860-Rhodomonas_salina.1